MDYVDLITISGSLPKGLSNDFYGKLIEIAHHKNVPVLLDAGGSLIVRTLGSGVLPFLIKPNAEEFSEIIGKEITQ